MRTKLLLGLVFFILFIGCDWDNKNYHSFSDNIWKSKDLIKFNLTVEDSTKEYSTNISLRHTTSYRYQNIIVFVHHYFNKNKLKTDTINIFLAEDNGKWIGKGKSNIREITHRYNKNAIYQKGTHSFQLELAMREKELLQIKELNSISDISVYLSTRTDH